MTVDGKGNCTVAGTFLGTVDFDPGAGSFSLRAQEASEPAFHARINAAGKFVFAGAFLDETDGTLEPVCSIQALATDVNGNIYLTGIFNERFDFDPGPGEFVLAPIGEFNLFAAKLGRTGNFIWAGKFGGASVGVDARAVAVDLNENFVLAGTIGGDLPVDMDPGPDNFLINPLGGGLMFAEKLSGVPPAVKSFQRGSPTPTNLTSVSYVITFTQAVTGVDVGDFSLAATGLTGAAITRVSGSGATYRVLVTTGTGSGKLRLDFVDNDSVVNVDLDPVGDVGTGNGNVRGPIYVVDKVLPTVTMTSDAPDPTTDKRIHVTVTVPQSIFGLTKSDIVAGNAKVRNFAGSGAMYTFDLVALGAGLVTADIPRGAAVDEAGNDTQAATQFSRMYQPGP